uniref:Nuclear protein, coactivator of histone transcription n=1 Tax=Crocodylus porosus TaxID=8502 RepID=A0A7M4F9F9_CROPO
MLLPSDVARLVLGYLQQEKLSATCREFILESSDLKEYAEHCTEDGSVPACLLSLFGKNLTTILNEYVAMKTKETTIEVPAMMSSLWKKLDYTLSQIRGLHLPYSSFKAGDSIHIQVPGPQERKLHSSLLSPQLVIENAREKILSNKSLQEKLAENINKFLGSDGSVTQAPKQTDSGLAEQESAIDEILGLQGEIHMSEEAIQDILEQTESDPAFQALFDLFDYGKNKTNKNLPHGVSSQSGVESTVVGEENNLNTLESSLETEEVRDNSTGALSCKDYHPEEAVHTLKNSSGDSGDTGQKSVTSEQSPRSSKPKNQTETLKAVTDEQIGELEIAFESVPDLTELNKKQNSRTSCNEHCVDSYSNKEAAELVSESETAVETEKDPQYHNAQNRPGLEYDHSEIPQSSLPSLDEDTVSSENRMYSVRDCHLSPDTSLSEKLNSKRSHRSPGHSVMLKKINASISNQSADSGKNEQDVSKDIPMLPVVLQQNSSHQSSCQEQDKRSDCGESSMVNLLDPKKTELQLEVVDTSNKPYSDDQHTLKSCTKDLNLHSESSNSEKTQVEMQEPSSSTKADADTVTFSSGDDGCAEISIISTESNPAIVETCRSPPGTASSTDEPSTELKRIGGVSSSSQPMDVDPANIMSLKIIISDDPFISSDSELNNAVNSITGENLPTIVLSSPTKSPAKTTGQSKCLTSEEIERSGDSALVEQNLLVLRPKDPVISTVGTKNEDCTVLTVAGTTNIAKDGGFIQLLPTTSTAFGNSNNLYIATCVTDPTVLGTTVTPSNVVVFPGNSMPLAAQAPAAQQLRTPPRSSSTFATSQTMSPNFSQGSAIIIASPVQPVLQGMVGMIPISVVGQNGNTFSAPSHQVLHVPISNPVCNRSVPKLPIPPKAQKSTGARSKSNIGTVTGNSDRNVSADQGRKLEETSLTAVGETTNSNSKQNESHRRVLCFDSALPAPGGNAQVPAMSSLQKEKSENSLFAVDSPSATSASLKIQPSKREKEKTLPRILCKPEIGSNRGAVVKEAQPERKSLASGVGLESFHKTTANKENELRRDTDDKQNNQEAAKLSNGQQNTGLRNEKTAASVQDVNKKTGTLSNGSSKSSGTVSLSSKEPKQDQAKSSSQGLCLASPLTKQAVEMLHDIQWNSPASKAVENGDLPVPRTPSGVGDRHTDDTTDSIRTPTCRRYNEDSTTPRIMVPPATPDLPACSPTSETGSENSVSMAAHTLMILSRAAIARTSTTTPLKDNTQQFRSLRSTGKKRKLEDLNEGERLSRSASRKDLQSSTTPMKKKKIKKKKLPNSFPAGMDVDKFLLSLHYDE